MSPNLPTSDMCFDDAALFGIAFVHAAIGMAIVSPEGRFLKVNHALCEITGYEEAVLLTLDFQTITHPDDLQQDLHHLRNLVAGKIQRYDMEKRYIRPDRSVVYINLCVAVVRHADGTPRFFISQMQNITDRVKSRIELEQFFSLSMNLMATIGFDGYLKQVNPAFSRVLGYSANELLTRPYVEILHPDDIPAAAAAVDRLRDHRRDMDLKVRVRHADGYYRHLVWNSFFPEGDEVFYTVAYDLTEVELTVQELESTNQRLGKALKELNALRGIVPICSCCKKIRNDADYWQTLEQFVEQHVGAVFSHGLCPTCLTSAQAEMQAYIKNRNNPRASVFSRQSVEMNELVGPDEAGDI